MKQRDVTDKGQMRWTCVQAYAGLEGKISEKVEELSETDVGKVQVVCTPSGGAQSVRIELKKNWEEDVSDDDLINAILNAQQN
jgi:hypothetical protein